MYVCMYVCMCAYVNVCIQKVSVGVPEYMRYTESFNHANG